MKDTSSRVKHPEDYEKRKRARGIIRKIQADENVNYTTAVRMWEAGYHEMSEAEKQAYWAEDKRAS